MAINDIEHNNAGQVALPDGRRGHTQIRYPEVANTAARLALAQSVLDRTGHVRQTDDGSIWAADGAGGWVQVAVGEGALQTTDGTLTTIGTYETQADSTLITVRALLTGRQPGSDNVAKYVIEALYNRSSASVVTQKQNLPVIASYADSGSWDGLITFSGTDILARVQGAAATIVNWKLQWEIDEHG